MDLRLRQSIRFQGLTQCLIPSITNVPHCGEAYRYSVNIHVTLHIPLGLVYSGEVPWCHVCAALFIVNP